MNKPRKLVSKRVRITKSKKALRKKCHQSHYNSNDKGAVRRAKRPIQQFNKSTAKKLDSLM